MPSAPPSTLYALARSGLVLVGLLLFAVGVGNVVTAYSKIDQYEELLRVTTPRVAPDPAALFPSVSEGEERHELARAKLAFYQLLLTAGRLLGAAGTFLVALGVLRVWVRAPRAPANYPSAN